MAAAAGGVTADLVGKRVKIIKRDGGEFTADVMSVDAGSPFVLFRTPQDHTNLKADYRMLRDDEIASVTFIGDGAPLPTLRPMPPADLERRKKEIDRKLALYGHGVSKEAQALVHKLAINFPHIRWQDQDIVVNEAFVIRQPYTSIAVGRSVDAAAVETQRARLTQILAQAVKEVGLA